MAYHLGLGWAQGGLLGVGVFFTLSGYLITDLLLGQYEATGRLQLADFWLRRARPRTAGSSQTAFTTPPPDMRRVPP